MMDLLSFLYGPVERIPWRVTALFGAFLSFVIAADGVPLSRAIGLATCLAAGFAGASRREFDQGLLAVFGAILIANLVGLAAQLGTHAAGPLDLPLPGMLLIGVPVGAIGAGIGAWVSYCAKGEH